MNGPSGILWQVLTIVGYLLSSATILLLLAAVIKWLVRKPEGWDAADTEADEEDLAADEPALEEALEQDGPGDAEAAVANLPPPGPKERTRRLLATNDVFHADLMSALLRDAGIWSFVHGNADAVGATGVPATGLYVAERDLERAKGLIADAEQRAAAMRRARGELRCFTCGYDLRGTTGACPECGTAAPA